MKSGHAIDTTVLQKARTFWVEFRQAAIRRDAAVLVMLSVQSLDIRGEADSDLVQKISGDDRSVALLHLFDREVFLGAGQLAVPLYELIEKTPTLPDSSWVAPTQLRVHNLMFELSPTGVWRLSRVYAEEP